jgi:hypothetical protein
VIRDLLLASALLAGAARAQEEPAPAPLQVSGVHPHLAVFNGGGECGIGAVVPWAGRLWLLTYPPHASKGSPDKLYEIDPSLRMTIRPESVGGTHAGRLVHRESDQLVMGPYFIDAKGTVRTADLSRLAGRLTAVARHLEDPASRVYVFDMEGAIYDVDVRTLDVRKLFEKPVPGWHGKGAYTAQGRLVVSNNGELAVGKARPAYAAVEADPKDPENAGALAEWDGKAWRVVERRQFTEVTGPGGIYGNPDAESPLWATGWDRRSVILKLLDGGRWSSFRLPKASHAFDPRHGWYTEWPRIRETEPGRLLLAMHGMLYDFPKGFRTGATGGLRPRCSHLRYVTDFCAWEGRLVLASDDTSIMKNPMAGQSQSNLWFGSHDDLARWGPASGWGGPWRDDPVPAGVPSDPFLVRGFERIVLHLSHDAPVPVTFTLEADAKGDGAWTEVRSTEVPARGYRFEILPRGFDAAWVRLKAGRACRATAYFHLGSSGRERDGTLFAGLADLGTQGVQGGIVRPASHNRNLQWRTADGRSLEFDEALRVHAAEQGRAEEVVRVGSVARDFEVDEASVVMTQKGRRYRLPKGDARFDAPFAAGAPRGIREVASERYLANLHGTFYEIPRDDGLPLLKPVASHRKQILDFCTWRGLLVLCGTRPGATGDGHVFGRGEDALWFGAIDDLWRLGKPVGRGGPWKDALVQAGAPSDPYLMTGYDRKRLELSHDAAEEAAFILEVDVDHGGWKRYGTFRVPAGRPLVHEFPEGYSAHWVRLTPDRACRATALFTYE